MAKKGFIILFLSFVMLLSACSSQNSDFPSNDKGSSSAKEAKKEVKVDQEPEISVEKPPEAPDTMEEILQKPAGNLMNKVYDTSKPIEVTEYEGNLIKLKEERNKVIDKLVKDNKASKTAEDWYNLIVYLLASNYKPMDENMKAFEVDFPTFKLPNGQTFEEYEKNGLPVNLNNVIILLDASGSMKAEVDGESRMAIAKETIKKFASGLPKEAKLGVRVFGQKGTGSDKDKKKSCKSSKLAYAIQTHDSSALDKALSGVSPKGWTPLALAMNKAKDDLEKKFEKGTGSMVIVISDGEETCGGKPIQAAKDLHKSDIGVKVNIIGFDVNTKSQKQLKKAAKAGDGTYATVNSKDAFQDQFQQWKPGILDRADMYFAGPNFWDEKDQYDRFGKRIGKYDDAYKREVDRLKDALNYISEEKGYINDETEDDLEWDIGKLIDQREEMLADYHETVRKEIYKKIEDEFNRLNEIAEDFRSHFE